MLDYAQLGISILTLIIVGWYTLETKRYREIAQRTLDNQVAQFEADKRPWIMLNGISFETNVRDFKTYLFIKNNGHLPAECKLELDSIQAKTKEGVAVLKCVQPRESLVAWPVQADQQTKSAFPLALEDPAPEHVRKCESIDFYFKISYRALTTDTTQYPYYTKGVYTIGHFLGGGAMIHYGTLSKTEVV